MTRIGPLHEREIVFFGGKGGVGKTTIASAFALNATNKGKRTLLVSSDPAHSTSDILEASLGSTAKLVKADLWAMEIDPSAEADRYIESVKTHIAEATAPRLASEVERQIDIARVAPGAEEAALFERFTRIIAEERERFDLIVFDTAPTAQTLRLLTLPEQMFTWIGGLVSQRRKVNALGRMWRNVAGTALNDKEKNHDPILSALEARRARFETTRKILTNPQLSAFSFVVIPERLPIWETERTVNILGKHDIAVGGIVINRILPADEVGGFFARRREQQRPYLERIERSFRAFTTYHANLQERDVVGLEDLWALAQHIQFDSNS